MLRNASNPTFMQHRIQKQRLTESSTSQHSCAFHQQPYANANEERRHIRQSSAASNRLTGVSPFPRHHILLTRLLTLNSKVYTRQQNGKQSSMRGCLGEEGFCADVPNQRGDCLQSASPISNAIAQIKSVQNLPEGIACKFNSYSIVVCTCM